MNKYKIVILLILVACVPVLETTAKNPKEYMGTAKAAIVFDVKGPVKSISLKSDNLLSQMFKKVKFNKKGEVNKPSFMYDSDGYPTGNGVAVANFRSYTYLFSNKNKEILDSATYITTTPEGNELIAKMQNLYHNNMLNGRHYHSVCGDNSLDASFDYKVEETDDYGNWTRRKVTQTTVKNDGQPEVTEYIETRKITYYK